MSILEKTDIYPGNYQFYKVVTLDRGWHLMSAVVVGTAAALEYYPHQWTHSKVGPIFIFDNFGYARDFMEVVTPELGQIWKCEAHNIYKINKQLMVQDIIRGGSALLRDFWERRDVSSWKEEWPWFSEYRNIGIAVAADSIKLTRRMRTK